MWCFALPIFGIKEQASVLSDADDVSVTSLYVVMHTFEMAFSD